MSFPLLEEAITALICLALGLYFWKRNSIAVSGFISLLVICFTFILLQHKDLLVILFYMFASSSLLTKFKKEQKKEFELVVAKSGPRDYVQAIANLGPACLCMLLFHYCRSEIYLAAFISSVAAANADSWASEIGGLAKTTPVLITTLKPVEKGISGGVTWLGTLGGAAGSAFIVFASYLTLKISDTAPPSSLLLIAFMAGVAGFIFDSLLGATVQALYRNQAAPGVTESGIAGNELVKGYKVLDNDAVNLITTIFAAILGGLFYLAIK